MAAELIRLRELNALLIDALEDIEKKMHTCQIYSFLPCAGCRAMTALDGKALNPKEAP